MTSLLNTLYGRRYARHSFVGSGSFGKVFKCVDIFTRETVAIKMLKINLRNFGSPMYLNEVAMMKKVRCLDRDNIVHFHHHFMHKGHVCLVFEMLDMSLFDLMLMRRFKPFSVKEIRPVIQQLLMALKALRGAGVIHADIKPDNVMLVNQKDQPFKVKLIDFGLALSVTDAKQNQGVKMQTRYYRSPEVLLGLPISHEMDTWSLGCIMACMVMGRHLYPGRCEYDMIRFIIWAQGMPAEQLLNAGVKTTVHFKWDQNVWRLKTPEEYFYETGVKPTDNRGYNFSSLDDMMKVRPELAQDEVIDMIVFMVLMKNMLHLDATHRLWPNEALEHPFISMSHLVGKSSYVKASVQAMRVCTRETVQSTAQRPDCTNITSKGMLPNPSRHQRGPRSAPGLLRFVSRPTLL